MIEGQRQREEKRDSGNLMVSTACLKMWLEIYIHHLLRFEELFSARMESVMCSVNMPTFSHL